MSHNPQLGDSHDWDESSVEEEFESESNNNPESSQSVSYHQPTLPSSLDQHDHTQLDGQRHIPSPSLQSVSHAPQLAAPLDHASYEDELELAARDHEHPHEPHDEQAQELIDAIDAAAQAAPIPTSFPTPLPPVSISTLRPNTPQRTRFANSLQQSSVAHAPTIDLTTAPVRKLTFASQQLHTDEVLYLLNEAFINVNHIPPSLRNLPIQSVAVDLDLSSNEIEGEASSFLQPLVINHIPLLKLNVAHNRIRDIQGLIPFGSTLIQLNLSHNTLSQLEHIFRTCTNLTSLDLSFNQLTSINGSGLAFASRLTRLNLQSNRLRRIDELRSHPSLEQLDLRSNILTDPEVILVTLTSITRLERLALEGNQVFHVRKVGTPAVGAVTRPDIIAHLPQLKFLDDESVISPPVTTQPKRSPSPGPVATTLKRPPSPHSQPGPARGRVPTPTHANPTAATMNTSMPLNQRAPSPAAAARLNASFGASSSTAPLTTADLRSPSPTTSSASRLPPTTSVPLNDINPYRPPSGTANSRGSASPTPSTEQLARLSPQLVAGGARASSPTTAKKTPASSSSSSQVRSSSVPRKPRETLTRVERGARTPVNERMERREYVNRPPIEASTPSVPAAALRPPSPSTAATIAVDSLAPMRSIIIPATPKVDPIQVSLTRELISLNQQLIATTNELTKSESKRLELTRLQQEEQQKQHKAMHHAQVMHAHARTTPSTPVSGPTISTLASMNLPSFSAASSPSMTSHPPPSLPPPSSSSSSTTNNALAEMKAMLLERATNRRKLNAQTSAAHATANTHIASGAHSMTTTSSRPHSSAASVISAHDYLGPPSGVGPIGGEGAAASLSSLAYSPGSATLVQSGNQFASLVDAIDSIVAKSQTRPTSRNAVHPSNLTSPHRASSDQPSSNHLTTNNHTIEPDSSPSSNLPTSHLEQLASESFEDVTIRHATASLQPQYQQPQQSQPLHPQQHQSLPASHSHTRRGSRSLEEAKSVSLADVLGSTTFNLSAVANAGSQRASKVNTPTTSGPNSPSKVTRPSSATGVQATYASQASLEQSFDELEIPDESQQPETNSSEPTHNDPSISTATSPNSSIRRNAGFSPSSKLDVNNLSLTDLRVENLLLRKKGGALLSKFQALREETKVQEQMLLEQRRTNDVHLGLSTVSKVLALHTRQSLLRSFQHWLNVLAHLRQRHLHSFHRVLQRQQSRLQSDERESLLRSWHHWKLFLHLYRFQAFKTRWTRDWENDLAEKEKSKACDMIATIVAADRTRMRRFELMRALRTWKTRVQLLRLHQDLSLQVQSATDEKQVLIKLVLDHKTSLEQAKQHQQEFSVSSQIAAASLVARAEKAEKEVLVQEHLVRSMDAQQETLTKQHLLRLERTQHRARACVLLSELTHRRLRGQLQGAFRRWIGFTCGTSALCSRTSFFETMTRVKQQVAGLKAATVATNATAEPALTSQPMTNPTMHQDTSSVSVQPQLPIAVDSNPNTVAPPVHRPLTLDELLERTPSDTNGGFGVNSFAQNQDGPGPIPTPSANGALHFAPAPPMPWMLSSYGQQTQQRQHPHPNIPATQMAQYAPNHDIHQLTHAPLNGPSTVDQNRLYSTLLPPSSQPSPTSLDAELFAAQEARRQLEMETAAIAEKIAAARARVAAANQGQQQLQQGQQSSGLPSIPYQQPQTQYHQRAPFYSSLPSTQAPMIARQQQHLPSNHPNSQSKLRTAVPPTQQFFSRQQRQKFQ